MSDSQRRVTGVFFIVLPVVFTACFFVLQSTFEYPDILRQPTGEVLAKFQAGGIQLIATWYVLTLTALLFVPASLLMHRTLADHPRSEMLRIATGFGVTAGLVQTLGFIRWPFLVPRLADAYLSPVSTESERAAAAMVFEAFHTYAGVAIGEHLGYLCTAVWTLLISIVLLRSSLVNRWVAMSGIAWSIGIAFGLVEILGVDIAGPINAIGYILWSIWLVILGISFIIVSRRTPSNPVPATT